MKRIVGEKIDGKAKSENDKGSLGARLIHYPVVRGISFFFFLYQTLGFKWKGGRQESGRQIQLIGSWSLWQIGSKTFLTWQGICRLKHTHTQIDPDTHPYAVTFYLSFLFIIVRQCKRQTGKGYDVNEQEFVATKRSGNTSSGGHFSCG